MAALLGHLQQEGRVVAAVGVLRRCLGRTAAEHEVMAEGAAYLANPDKPIKKKTINLFQPAIVSLLYLSC
jgi:hypothetical protein